MKKPESKLIGRRIGKLVVVRYLSGSDYLLRCDCGKEVIRRSGNISSNPKYIKESSSCGCAKKHNLSGQRFGRLTVISYFKNDKHKKPLWNCKCDCGKFHIACGMLLKNGNVKSCGCLLKEFQDQVSREARETQILIEGKVYEPHFKESRKLRSAESLSKTPKNIRRYERYHSDPAYRLKSISSAVRNQRIARESAIFRSAKHRAKKHGLPFNIEISDIVIPEVCPVLGLTIDRGHNKQKDCSPTIDKFVPSLGYVKGNIRVISWRANRLKSDAAIEEIEKVLEYMKGLR